MTAREIGAHARPQKPGTQRLPGGDTSSDIARVETFNGNYPALRAHLPINPLPFIG